MLLIADGVECCVCSGLEAVFIQYGHLFSFWSILVGVGD